jgi:acylphosphatase
MGAPKGNDYGKEFRFKSSVANQGDRSVHIGTRLTREEVEEIKQQLQQGETLASWLRERVRESLAASQS